MFLHTIYLVSRKLGINWGKNNSYGSVTKQCYGTHSLTKRSILPLGYSCNVHIKA